MTKNSTGVYYYNYDTIQSSATYGKYKVKVETSSGASVGMFWDKFYVMPWQVEKDVRQITGVSETKDITDDDLSDICWKAYKEALRDVHIHHYKDVPLCNPQTGVNVNGVNTTFQTPNYPIADINGDGTVLGNNTSCATDVESWWIDTNGSYQRAIVTVYKHKNGEITITQNDGTTAIPSTYKGLYLDYWTEYESYDNDIFQNAVSHLAADMLIRRLKEIDRVTVADLASNQPIIEKDSRRFKRKYKQLINRVSRPRIGGV